MDEETKGNLMEERRWYQPLRVIGWFVLAVAALYDLRLVYEQTLLTWKDGPQMVGFSMVHVFPVLLLLGALGFLGCSSWIASFLFFALRNRVIHGGPLAAALWLQALVVALAVAIPLIPYSAWKVITVEIAGPGPHGPNLLVDAAADGDIYLTGRLLKKGVLVDATGWNGATALNAACVTQELEVARKLIAQGANPDKARDCWNIAEFRAKMKPIVPGADPYANFPHVPSTTIYVDGSKTTSDSSHSPLQ